MESADRIERTRKVQETLFRIFDVLAMPGDLEHTLSRIHDQLWDVLDASNMYVALFDERSGLYVFPYNADEDEGIDIPPQQLLKSLTDYVRRTGEPLFCDASRFREIAEAGQVEPVGMDCEVWLGAPLITARGSIGAVVVQSYVDATAYDRQDLETLSLVGRCMAHAIEHTWLRQREEAEHTLRIRELVLSRDEALAASAAKSSFLATMSHELRTPLTAILGYAELLAEELPGRDSSAHRDLDRIVTSADHLKSVISNILDVSRIEAGEVELNLTTVDVKVLLDQAASVCGSIVSAGGNRLVVKADPAADTVYTDATKVRQVLLNLIANAAAYTRDGTITVRARRVIDDHDWLVLEVADTGEGIPQDVLPRLWGAFERGESVTTLARDGTGLGLTICRGLCRLLGGDCSAASVPGSGSTFTARVRAG